MDCIHLSRFITDTALTDGLCRLFGCSIKDISLVGEFCDSTTNRSGELLVVRRVRGGDFPLELEVYSQAGNQLSELDLAKRIACEFECRCLIADETPNPYSWIEVSAIGTPRAVFVDVESLDEREEFVLKG